MKEKKPMTEEAVYVGVDIAKSTMDVALCSTEEVQQFASDEDGISSTVHYLGLLKPTGIIGCINGGEI
jgi:hypothetical protein